MPFSRISKFEKSKRFQKIQILGGIHRMHVFDRESFWSNNLIISLFFYSDFLTMFVLLRRSNFPLSNSFSS